MITVRSTPVAIVIAIVVLGTASACTGSGHGSARSAPAVTSSLTRSPTRLVRPASALPADGTYVSGTTRLIGHRRYVDRKRSGHPVLWTTDGVLADAGDIWGKLVAAYPSTGLYPVVLQASETRPDDGRPWITGEFDLSARTNPDRAGSPAKLLASLYKQTLEEFDNTGVPTRTLPALRTTVSGGPVLETARQQAAGLPGRIGLVAVARPADVPYAIGWLGATNYFDGGVVTAVLRSWEDRYGTQLIRMGFDYLQVSVPNPPQTLAAAQQVALEHVAFCPDQVYQEAGSFAAFATSLVGAHSWFCSWD